MPEKEDAILVDGLTFGYADKLFLKDVSFHVRKGDFAAIIGDNGSGKSTMVKLLLGLLSPIAGTIRIMGNEVKQIRDFSGIGYVPQNSGDSVARFPASAEEIVLSSLYRQIGPFRFPGKKHREIARKALAQTGLSEYAKVMPESMSGGQRQRLMLARVLACGPELLVLDEPTVGIDSDAVDQLLSILHEINISGKVTILMVTHDLSKIAAYTNRVLCLSEKHFSEEDLPTGTVVHIHPLSHDHQYEHVHCASCPKPHITEDCAACKRQRDGGK